MVYITIQVRRILVRHLDRSIEKSDSIQQILNKDFYYVQMNAESRDPIKFNGTTYNARTNGLSPGVHELAETLGKEDARLELS